MVKFKDGVTKESISKINKKNGTEVLSKGKYAKFTRIKVPIGKTISSMVKIYSQNKNVLYAEPNYLATAFTSYVPNDEYYSYQWNFKSSTAGIDMEPVWDTMQNRGNYPSYGTIVAIVDTGVAYKNKNKKFKGGSYEIASDLVGNTFIVDTSLKADIINNDSEPMDDNGHGTHVAGTIAQATNNDIDGDGVGEGVAGIAYKKVGIMPVKVLDQSGSGSYNAIAEGILFAANNGARVINLSLGGSFDSVTLRSAVQDAYAAGVTLICAAGNEYETGNTISYPAAYPECIGVGATTYAKVKAYYSNTGSYVEIAAPGGDTRYDLNNDNYVDGILQQTFGRNPSDWSYYFYQGTSMAAPHVSAIAALFLAENPSLLLESDPSVIPLKVKEALLFNAKQLEQLSYGRNNIYGWGLLDAPDTLAYNSTTTFPDLETSIDIVNGGGTDGFTLYRSESSYTIDVIISVLESSSSTHNTIVELFDTTEGVVIGSVVSNSDGGDYSFNWDVSNTSLGVHKLRARVSSLHDEINTVNNYSYVSVTIEESEAGTNPDPDPDVSSAKVGTITTSYKKTRKK